MIILLQYNGGEFNSDLVREFAENFTINIITTAAYSPWSNGTVERHNGIPVLMIAKLCETFPDFKDLDYMIVKAPGHKQHRHAVARQICRDCRNLP